MRTRANIARPNVWQASLLPAPLAGVLSAPFFNQSDPATWGMAFVVFCLLPWVASGIRAATRPNLTVSPGGCA